MIIDPIKLGVVGISAFLATIITFFLNSFKSDGYTAEKDLILDIERIFKYSVDEVQILKKYFLGDDYRVYFYIYSKIDRLFKIFLLISLANFCCGIVLCYIDNQYCIISIYTGVFVAVLLTICCAWFYYAERELSKYGNRLFQRYVNVLQYVRLDPDISVLTGEKIEYAWLKYGRTRGGDR